MKNKKETHIEDWTKGISEIGKRNREINCTLSPSKTEIRYIVDYARSILEKAHNIEMASSLGHEKAIDFEQAQNIINWQKVQLEQNIKHLQVYLKEEE